MLVVLTLTIGCHAQLTSATAGTVYRYNQGFSAKWILGDTWSCTKGDDGVIYCVCNDTVGWQGTISGGRNILMSTLTTYDSTATGANANTLDDFGTEAQPGSDGKNFKTQGLISVAGCQYLTTVRQVTSSPYIGQSGAQLVKSCDHWATYTPHPPSTANAFTSPMWPTGDFESIWFVQYGQDYACPGIDNCSTYVYGVSTTGGNQSQSNSMILGRVSIANLPNLSASDWTYYQGGDGMNPANWGAIGTASPIISNAGHVTASGIQYLSAFGVYITVQDYNPNTSFSNNRYWYYYWAPHPWGPWTNFQTTQWTPQGYYYPEIVPSSATPDGGQTLTIFTTGDYTMQNPSTGLYTLTEVPQTISGTLTPTNVGSQLTPGTQLNAGVSIQ